MPNISFFTHNMKQHIIRRQISYLELENIHRIELLCPSTEFHSDTIYIGAASDAADLLRLRQPENRITIFSADDNYRLDPYFKWKNLNLISTTWSLADLYNHVNKIWTYYYRWDLAIATSLCQGHNLQQIIQTAGHMLKGHVLLLNPGYVLITYSTTDAYSDPIAEELCHKGYLDYDHVRLFNQTLEESSCFRNDIHRFTLDSTGNQYYIMPVITGDILLARLIFIVNDLHRDMDLFEMMSSLGSIICKLLIEQYTVPKTTNSEFLSFLADYEKKGTLNDLEIQNRFQLFPVKVETFLRCIIIHFKDKPEDIPFDFLINQLNDILPNCNLTVWKDEIVLMQSSRDRIRDISCNPELPVLNEFLERFHAIAIFSAVSRYPEKFYTLYKLSDRLLQILIQMKMRSIHENIYDYKEHAIYLTIDMAARQFREELHHPEIIYLADASVIALSRYDQQHHSDLMHLLYYYLLNGRNVTKTAQMLYMHRNTVLNKLNKINEIINLPLDDGNIQQRLLFSCQVVNYYQDFLSIRLNL